jgi:CubicO group peptidase (beta-lactamase class C family)
MKLVTSYFLLASVYALTLIAQNTTDHFLQTLNHSRDKIDTLIHAYMDLDLFSGVVLIAHQGLPIYHQAFGLANRTNGEINTIHTRFDIGSMNKTFTKVVVLQLIAEGKLRFEDRLDQFINGFRDQRTSAITIRHLLDHESGFDDYHTEAYWSLPLEKKNLSATVELIRQMPLHFSPGSDQMYSNTGYVLLGAIVEKVTGVSYYDAVDQRIIKKLNLKNTFIRSKYDVPLRAVGYLKTMRGVLEDNDYLQEMPTPAGGFYSTTEDILKFYRAYFYSDRLVPAEVRKEDAFSEILAEVKNKGGYLPFAGGFEGANTIIFENLHDQISVIVFANMDEPVAENLGLGIIHILRGKDPQKPAIPAIQSVYKAYKENGIKFIKEHFEELTTNFHPTDPKDLILNNIGYNLLFSDQEGEAHEAIEIFQLNTELFSEIANTWDSLGEALLKNGDQKKARDAYERALTINPDLLSAKMALEKMEKH